MLNRIGPKMEPCGTPEPGTPCGTPDGSLWYTTNDFFENA